MTGPSSRVPVLLVLVWLGGLLAATSVGLLAVRLVAVQVGDPAVAPLSAVAAASAGASSSGTPAPPPPSPTSSPSPSPSPPRLPPPSPATTTATRTPVPPVTGATATRTVATAAGTVGVQCVGTGLRLLYATPAQGYALDERSVTGAQAEVRFEGAGTRVRVRLSCATGAPRLVEQRTDPAGGGGGDDRVDRDDSVRDTDGGGGSRDDRDREDRDREDRDRDDSGGDGDD